MGLHLSGHRAAVLGRPIDHSLSPVLHLAAYAALGLTDWQYDKIDCGADDVASLLSGAGPEWVGFSVTMPAKRAALDAASTVTDLAASVGAANTVLRSPDGGWLADNTDVYALATVLGRRGVRDRQPVVVLGAGGTAQAALAALHQLGMSAVQVVVRDRSRADELIATAARVGITVELLVSGTSAGGAALRSCHLLVSTLPAGGADSLADVRWQPSLVALDVVYDGWPSVLASSVVAGGGTALSGAQVLMHQAVEQVRLMTGRQAPVAAMQAALRAHVGTALDVA